MTTIKEENTTQELPPLPAKPFRWGKTAALSWTDVFTGERLAWIALAFAAILTRFWNLGARVTSHDESLHIYYSWMFARGNGYVHNPMMHGPLLFELTAFFDRIFGANDFTGRIVPALFGIGIVVGIPLLFRRWLGRWGALAAGLLLLVSPYVLYFSRYNRHDIEIITWALIAAGAMLAYIHLRDSSAAREAVLDPAPSPAETAQSETVAEAAADYQEPPLDILESDGQALQPEGDETPVMELVAHESDEFPEAQIPAAAQQAAGDQWLLILAGAEALMFTAMETSFFYLAIFASFLIVRILMRCGFHWQRIRKSADWDVLVVLATLGAFFSSPIIFLVLNPIWTRLTGQAFVPLTEFSSYGIEWANGVYGVRVWGTLAIFWIGSAVVGLLWGGRRWLELAGVFLAITITSFTTFFTNLPGIGTGFVGSLGYWLSQQGVARGSQPWYFYLIVFPLYEYLPILGGLAAGVFYGIRRKTFSAATRTFVPLMLWWAFVIFTGLTLAGEKMPWLSTHITVPFILLTAWLVGRLIVWALGRRDVESGIILRPAIGWVVAAALPLIVLYAMTVRTSYLVNYVNYDMVTEFIDYAHGAPGVKWLMADVDRISALTGEGDAMPVAYDSANSWPLAWYLRNHPGFYGDQPNRADLQRAPVVIAGPQNWQKIENLLGPEYTRFEVIRIWWPMEGYKDMSWKRISGALVNPEKRAAIWDIFWSRDYSRYAKITGENLNPPMKWSLEDRMRVYIRKDVVAKISDLKLSVAQIGDIPVQVDAYATKRVTTNPLQVLPTAGLLNPRSMAFAPDGSVYVLDTGNSRVMHLDARGQVLASWGSATPKDQTPAANSTFSEPWGIAVDAKGNVFVADTWNHRIQKFDSQGNFLLAWGVAGLSADGLDHFWGPRGIVVSADGTVYVTDTGNRRVVAFDENGKGLFEFKSDGDARLNEPVGITMDASGQILVADTWNMRLAKFDSQGNYLTSWSVQAWTNVTNNEKPFVTTDASGNVYLSDPEENRIMVFNTTGAILGVFGELGSADNSFNLPTGLAMSPSGSLWVTDTGNNRIVVYPAFRAQQ
jgi:predicted membrane-bound mannosyltransferase/DNA-binding beta-propeller fold protein YncE